MVEMEWLGMVEPCKQTFPFPAKTCQFPYHFFILAHTLLRFWIQVQYWNQSDSTNNVVKIPETLWFLQPQLWLKYFSIVTCNPLSQSMSRQRTPTTKVNLLYTHLIPRPLVIENSPLFLAQLHIGNSLVRYSLWPIQSCTLIRTWGANTQELTH